MKKIIDFTTMAIIAAGAAAILFHFDAKAEITGFVRNMVHRIVPWVDLTVYT